MGSKLHGREGMLDKSTCEYDTSRTCVGTVLTTDVHSTRDVDSLQLKQKTLL